MEAAFPGARVEGYEDLISAMTNRIEDRHVLAAAVLAGAGVIVTRNVRHFPESSLSRYDVDVRTADAFLRSLLEQAPDVMTRILREQAAALVRPQHDVERVLQRIAIDAPGFAALARTMLEQE